MWPIFTQLLEDRDDPCHGPLGRFSSRSLVLDIGQLDFAMQSMTNQATKVRQPTAEDID